MNGTGRINKAHTRPGRPNELVNGIEPGRDGEIDTPPPI